MEFSGVPQHVQEEIGRSAADGVAFRAKTGHMHSTWARTFTSLPELYVRPQSVAEIEKTINLARRCRRRITTTGSGHSPSELSCTSSWLVNLDDYNRILSTDVDRGIVTMESGIRLYQLSEYLDSLGLAMPNLGSINEQSIAGVISTGTHGSSLFHGLISEDILSLKITLADGKTRSCSAAENGELFRSALLSLGALGIITEVTFRARKAFSLKWTQTIDTDAKVLENFSSLWTAGEFTRVWWVPYTRRAVVWSAQVSDEPHRDPPANGYDGTLGYYIYHNLLFLGRFVPSVLPWVEWFVFGMQYGFRNGSTVGAVQPSRKALLMNCLYSQSVNEWAIPLEKGPEALRRLSTWLNHLRPGDRDYTPHGIPYSSRGLYVHAPVEVRVSAPSPTAVAQPLLSPMRPDGGPTLYLNAIMYRPYFLDPPGVDRYYQGFEYLMLELGGRPHWAKNFLATGADVEAMYGDDLVRWRKVRDEADPEGMFVGSWHRRLVLGNGPVLPLEETEAGRQDQGARGFLYRGGQLDA